MQGSLELLFSNGIIKENSDNGEVHLYPNPASNSVKIVYSGGNPEHLESLELLDPKAMSLLYKMENMPGNGSSLIQFNIPAQLSNGIYLLRLRFRNGQELRSRLVVVR